MWITEKVRKEGGAPDDMAGLYMSRVNPDVYGALIGRRSQVSETWGWKRGRITSAAGKAVTVAMVRKVRAPSSWPLPYGEDEYLNSKHVSNFLQNVDMREVREKPP